MLTTIPHSPGDQHTAVANPFEEPQQRISEYTAQEIATLQARLEKQLGPEYISSRSGPGGSKVAYISADKCIGLANEVFGFNGWSSSLQNIQVDFVDKQDGKWHVGLSVIVRVTLRDGTYHEDIGYGQMENTKKAAAFEKAKKEGTTDALKRALRNFGNVLGNCLYDKTYLSNVAKVKAVPTKFDETRLHRHPDLAAHLAKEQKTVPPRPPPQCKTACPLRKELRANSITVLAADSFEDFYGGKLLSSPFVVPRLTIDRPGRGRTGLRRVRRRDRLTTLQRNRLKAIQHVQQNPESTQWREGHYAASKTVRAREFCR